MAAAVEKRRSAGASLTEGEILHWFVQAALALKHIHGLHILHRDIKTSNVFLTGGNCVKLGDFGISKVLQSTLESALTVVGTPYYMSPEVYESKPYTLKSDVWALGCFLYELCTFEHPFVADNLLSLGHKIAREQYKPLPACYSQELINLVTVMLLKDPNLRPSMGQIIGFPLVQKHLTISPGPTPIESCQPRRDSLPARTQRPCSHEAKKSALIHPVSLFLPSAQPQNRFEEIKRATRSAHTLLSM